MFSGQGLKKQLQWSQWILMTAADVYCMNWKLSQSWISCTCCWKGYRNKEEREDTVCAQLLGVFWLPSRSVQWSPCGCAALLCPGLCWTHRILCRRAELSSGWLTGFRKEHLECERLPKASNVQVFLTLTFLLKPGLSSWVVPLSWGFPSL